uniref:Uncharacterized protein n=1 Tax=Arundo donax TaxID=35708 RepID=A0A0A8YSF8_ARUDO
MESFYYVVLCACVHFAAFACAHCIVIYLQLIMYLFCG